MPRLRGAERMRLARALLLFILALALAACARTRLHLTEDLWQKWQAMDTLMQSDYPEVVPIVLVHGWNGSEFSWPDAQRLAAVEKRLGRDIYYFSYRSGVLTGRFPPLEIVEEELERYLRGFRRVDIVAHSMGGLLVRQYLRHHGSRRIRRLVFLATPHFGAEAAGTLAELAGINPAGSLQADELQPGSDFLWQLDIGEGAEMQGVQVLNVYVGDEGVAHADYIVGAHSAYLPWGRNTVFGAGHHDLARHFIDSKVIMDFLTTGALPRNAPPPPRHDLWLRLLDPRRHAYAEITAAAVRRLNTKRLPVHRRVFVCCKQPTRVGGGIVHTAVLEDVHVDETIVIKLGKDRTELRVHARRLLSRRQPVVLRELRLPMPRP